MVARVVNTNVFAGAIYPNPLISIRIPTNPIRIPCESPTPKRQILSKSHPNPFRSLHPKPAPPCHTLYEAHSLPSRLGRTCPSLLMPRHIGSTTQELCTHLLGFPWLTLTRPHCNACGTPARMANWSGTARTLRRLRPSASPCQSGSSRLAGSLLVGKAPKMGPANMYLSFDPV